MKLKAYKVTCLFDPPIIGIYWNYTAGKARYQSLKNAREVGYDIDFSCLKVKRAKQYDPPFYKPTEFGSGINIEYIHTRKINK